MRMKFTEYTPEELVGMPVKFYFGYTITNMRSAILTITKADQKTVTVSGGSLFEGEKVFSQDNGQDMSDMGVRLPISACKLIMKDQEIIERTNQRYADLKKQINMALDHNEYSFEQLEAVMAILSE